MAVSFLSMLKCYQFKIQIKENYRQTTTPMAINKLGIELYLKENPRKSFIGKCIRPKERLFLNKGGNKRAICFYLSMYLYVGPGNKC